MSGLGDFACRAHEVGLAEEVARTHTELTADDFLVEAVVAVDDDVVDTCLRAFDHAHLKRDGVARYFTLDGHEVVEEVTLVHVEVGHGVVVLGESLVHELLVVDVAGLHVEVGVQHLVGVDGVADPLDVLDVVLVAFVEVDVHVDLVVVVGHHAVRDYARVAEAFLVVLLEDAVEVVLIVALDEFLLREELENVVLLVGLLHGALDGAVGEDLVAVDIDFVHLDLVVLVHVDVDDDFVLVREVFVEVDAHGGVAESLVLVVLGDDGLCAVDDVARYLVALDEIEPLLQVLDFAFLGACVLDRAYARLSAEDYLEPRLVAGGLDQLDACLGEERLTHEALDGVGDVIAGNLHAVAHLEVGVSENQKVVVVRCALDFDASYLVG